MTRATPAAKRFRWEALVCALVGAVVFQFFGNAGRGYIDTASLYHWWGYQWLNPASETQHGWLILGLSAWLLWRNVHQAEANEGLRGGQGTSLEAANRPGRFPSAAAVALVGGLALHALGFAAQQSRLSILALLLFTWGVLRLGGGRRWGDAAMFPLGFMVFAIPLGVVDEVGLPLRVWVTTAGEYIAHAGGIDVLRSGTQLVAPDGKFHYDVAAPCSGVRSLMALTALGLLAAYLNFRSWWRRAVVLAWCFPLVYVGNVARIVSIMFAAQWGGVVWGARVHEAMGYGVFVIVLGGVLVVIAGIRREWPEAGNPAGIRGKPSPHSSAPAPAPPTAPLDGPGVAADPRLGAGTELERKPRRRNKSGWVVATLVAVVAGGEVLFLNGLATALPRGEVGVRLAPDGLNPVDLPAFLGTEWIGQRAEISAVEREILPADTGFSRRNYAYVADRNRDVFLSIVLSGRDRTSLHRPELCLVGQGWTIDTATRRTFRVEGTRAGDRPQDLAATVLRVRREISTPGGKVTVPQLVVYWYIGGRTVAATHWQRLVRDAWNRVVHARVDRWAYVLMQTNATDGETAALARIETIMNGTVPAFQPPGPTPSGIGKI